MYVVGGRPHVYGWSWSAPTGSGSLSTLACESTDCGFIGGLLVGCGWDALSSSPAAAARSRVRNNARVKRGTPSRQAPGTTPIPLSKFLLSRLFVLFSVLSHAPSTRHE